MSEALQEETYEPRCVFVTGGAGFIGSHVVIRLVRKFPHIRVINFDKLDYCSCLKNLEEIENAPNYRFVKGDICNLEMVRYVLESEKVDTIMHFAAQSHVDNSFGNSVVFSETNVVGTHVLLEVSKALRHQVKRFIHVSSDEVYGEIDTDQAAVDETARFWPTQPYSATKAAAELIVAAYLKSFHLPIIVTRGNNVYGPHQYPEKVVPKFINLLMRGMPVTVHGAGNSIRSFLYADDVADAFEIILFNGAIGEVYNIGTDSELSMLELAKVLIQHFGLEDRAARLITYVEDRPFNDCRYSIDSSKLHKLGWEPKTKFSDGIHKTVDWYKRYFNNWGNVEAALAPHPRTQLTPVPHSKF